MGIPPSQLPMKVIDAWHAASEWAQRTIIPEPVCARAVYWDGDCENDYLLGNWQGWGMGAPPPPCLPGQEWQFNETTHWINPDP